jgi:hypothetical protein
MADYSVYKFYKGGEENLYVGDSAMWWSYEKHFEESVYSGNAETKNEEFHKWLEWMIQDQLPSKWGLDPERLRERYDVDYSKPQD